MRARTLCAAAVLAGGVAVVPASGAAPPDCTAFDLSPSFATDRTAFCAGATDSTLVVHRTTDGGRSWTRTATPRAALPDGTPVAQVVVSAGFATDREVYVATGSLLYGSRDAGASFLLYGRLSGRLTRYTDPAGLASVAYAGTPPARLRPPLLHPVPGAPNATTSAFYLPPVLTAASEGLALTTAGIGANATRTFYACDAALACPTRRNDVADGGDVAGVWLSPAYDTDHTVYLATTANGWTFWRSTDGARSFQKWTTVNAALPKRVSESWRVALAFGANGRRWLRLPAAHDALLRSDDGGTHWKRVGRFPGGSGPDLVAAPDGRLFAMGAAGPWCSVDGGVRWARLCPR